MKKFYELGSYQQHIDIDNGKIAKMTCTCKHGSIYPNNWKEGKTICKTLTTYIKNGYRREKKENS